MRTTVFISLLLPGCFHGHPHHQEQVESHESEVTLSAWPTTGTTAVWRTDLALSGFAVAEGGAAVRTVELVDGPSTSLTTEGSFSLTAPLSWLVEHAEEAENGTHPVVLTLRARASDGGEGTTELTVLVDPTPAQPVDDLDLDVQYTSPTGAPEEGVPQNGAHPFTLALCADPSAAGSTLALSATGVTLSSTAPVLAPDAPSCEGADAGALVVGVGSSSSSVAAGQVRDVTLTAASGGLAWATTVPVYGAPWFGAATASQELGDVGHYDAASAAGLTECRAYGAPAQPVGVTAGDTAIQLVDPATGESHGWVDVGPVEALGLTVDSGGTTDAGTVTITCRDGWGQEGSTVITLVEPPQ